jgi:hypothetical protein
VSATVFYSSSAELATLTNTFKVNGTATDPTTITLTVTTPSGTATSYTYAASEITRTSAGVYTKDVACTEAGTWLYLWVGTGTASDAVAGTWTVFDTALQKRYCSLEETKSRLKIPDTGDDFEIALALDSASRWIDGYCDRRFWRGTDTRTYTPRDCHRVTIDDLVSLTSLATDAGGDGTFEQAWTTADYQLLPVNPNAGPEPRPYTSIRAVGSLTFPLPVWGLRRTDLVQVVGVFGYPEVPADVKQACLILTADYLAIAGAPFGVQGFGEFAVRIRDNTRVVSLLERYRRHPVLTA